MDFCLAGDALDLSCVSHWGYQDLPGTKRKGELKSDLDGFDKQILQPLEALLPRGCEKVFLTGNHERMPDQDLTESMPELDGMIDFKRYLHLTERGFNFTNHLSHWLMMGTMKHHETPPTVRPYGRLKLVGAGLAFAVVGTTFLLSGVQVVTHWTGQPMFSWGLIAAGGLCVVLAVIPASWIAKAATIDSRTPRHR